MRGQRRRRGREVHLHEVVERKCDARGHKEDGEREVGQSAPRPVVAGRLQDASRDASRAPRPRSRAPARAPRIQATARLGLAPSPTTRSSMRAHRALPASRPLYRALHPDTSQT